MSQQYKSSTDPQSTPGTSGMVTYSGFNGVDATHIKSTGSVNITADPIINGNLAVGSTALTLSDSTANGIHINNTGTGSVEIHMTNVGTSAGTTSGTLIQVTTDLNTRIVNEEAGSLFIGTNSTDQLIFHSDGKISKGTTSPDSDFNITNGTTVMGFKLAQSGAIPNNSDNACFSVVSSQTAGCAFRVRTDNASLATYFSEILLNSTGSASIALGITNNGAGDCVRVYDGSTLAFVIHDGGKVGINTTTATDYLDINSDTLRLRTTKTVATSTDDSGNVGSIAWDANYVYVKITSTGWARAVLNTTF